MSSMMVSNACATRVLASLTQPRIGVIFSPPRFPSLNVGCGLSRGFDCQYNYRQKSIRRCSWLVECKSPI